MNGWLSLLEVVMPFGQNLTAAKREGRATLIFNWTPNFTDADGFVLHRVACILSWLLE